MINKRCLAIKFQIIIIRLNSVGSDEVTRTQIFDEWQQFLARLQSISLKCVDENLASPEDVSIELMAFKLFLFHSLSEAQRLLILTEVLNVLSQVNEAVKSKRGTDGQVSAPRLLISRILFIFDYLSRNFEQPTPHLLSLVESSLLNISGSSMFAKGDDAGLVTLERIAQNFSSFKKPCKSQQKQTVAPTFYSLTQNSIEQLLRPQSGQNWHESDALKQLDHNKAYMNVLELASVFLDDHLNDKQNVAKPNEEHVSAVYGFIFAWSLLNSANSPIQLSIESLQYVAESLFNQLDMSLNDSCVYLNASPNVQHNLDLAQLFRVAFKTQNLAGIQEGFLKTALNVIAGSRQAASDFFLKFWTNKLSIHVGDHSLQFNLLKTNIELLSFHLRLLQEKFLQSNDSNSNTEHSYTSLIDLIISLVAAFKSNYKRMVLFEK